MKKIILFLMGILASAPMLAEEQSTEIDGITYTFDPDIPGNGAKLTDGKNITVSKLEIPKTITIGTKDYDVSIGQSAFWGNKNLNSVVIKEGVTSIGASAFNSCSNIKYIEIPSTITTVGSNAFANCSWLYHVCWKQNSPSIDNPTFLPSNTYMTLYVPNVANYSNNSNWTAKFGDRIYEGEMKEILYNNVTYYCATIGKQATLFAGNDKSISDFTVPNEFTVDGTSYSVKAIGRDAFNNFKSLKTIKIEEGITTINNSAFYNCSSLQKIELPSTLQTIGSSVFTNCSSLIHVSCKADPTKLDGSMFPDKEMMTLYVPIASVNNYSTNGQWFTKFGGRIYGGDMIQLTDESSGLTYICATDSKKATLFVGDKTKADIIVPSTFQKNGIEYEVTGIDRQAFSGYTSIINLTISENVTVIGPEAFKGCTNLKTVKLPASLGSIKSSAFNGCKNLVRVVNGVTVPFTIADNVFTSSKSLYVPVNTRDDYKITDGWKNFAIIMEGETEEIEYNNMNFICAMGSKEAILIKGDKISSDIVIPSTIPSVNGSSYQVIAIEKEAFSGATSLVTLTFEDGANNMSIGEKAFYSCSKLRMLTLPTSLDKMSSQAFSSCNNLVHIICKSRSPFNIDSNVFTTTKATLYVPISYGSDYRNCTGWGSFVNIVECDDMEEYSQDGITYVCLKNGDLLTATLTKGTNSVNDITIPYSITTGRRVYFVVSIAESAFLNCTGLKKVELPASLVGIGSNAFNGCNNLADIVSKIEVPFTIASTVFSNTAASLYVPIGKTEKYKGTDGWNNFTNIYEGDRVEVTSEKLTYVYATGGLTATLVKSETTDADVTIPSFVPGTKMQVTSIEKSAFTGNTYLVNLTIPEGVKTIGGYAFQKCSKLQKVVLPTTLTSIGVFAFDQCAKISTVVSGIKGSNLFVINDNVFSSTIYPTASVFVPIGDMAVYQGKGGWSNFSNYIEGERLQTTVDKMTYVYLTGAKTATLISTTNEDTDVTIPGFFKVGNDTIVVTAIDNSALKGNTKVVNLKISENIKTIGAYAFQNCTGLKKIELPSTLTSIGDKAFDGCKAVTHICSKVKTLFAFNTNVFPTTFTVVPTLFVPEGTKDTYKKTDGWNVFTNVVEGYLVDVLTLDGMTYDCLKKGEGNTATTVATLTKSATSIADVVIPDSIKLNEVFYKVTIIGKSAFSGNSKLVNITIPEYVTSIEESAFASCDKIVNIISKIKSPTEINNNVFSITSPTLYVPVGSRNKYKTTEGWSKFTTVYEGLMKEKTIGDMSYVYATGDKTALLVGTTTTAKDVVVPDSFAVDDSFYKVIAINKEVFKGKTSIVNLTLPSTMTQIGDNAFNGCTNLTTIVSKAVEPIAISDNVFSAYTATLYVPQNSKSKYQNATGWKSFATVYEGVWKEVTFDDGMTYVYATGDKTATLIKTTSSEKDVTIPGTFVVDNVTYKVTAIDNSVFKGNTNVVNLIISENIKSIGAYTFLNCSNLRRLELPSTLTDIGEKAFNGCKKLAHICSKSKAPFDIDENVFSAYTAILYVPDGTIGSYQARGGWSKFTNTMEGYFIDELVSDGMTFVCLKNGEGTSVSTTAVLTKSATTTATVAIPSSLEIDKVAYKVTTIGKSAFSGNSKLVNLTLSENIKAIGDEAFANCTNIAMITSMIKEPFVINDNVFSAYTATLYVPENTRSKYKDTAGWKNFASILEGVRNETTTEDGWTFEYVTGDKIATLIKASISDKDVTIPGSFKVGEVTYTVTAIGQNVFKGNKTIVNLKIAENVKTIGISAFQNCPNLEKIELPSTLTGIGESAFADCPRLSHIVVKVNPPFSINDNVFSESIYPTAKLYVPSVTSADYKTTAGWQNFTHILVGVLKEVTVDDLTYYCVEGPNVATLVKASSTSAAVTIPAQVVSGNVTYTVTDIGAYAFSGVSSLEKITISEGITSIGIGAFQNCNKLNEVVLPLSLTSIGDLAFDKCSRLALVVSHIKNPFAINDNVFPANTPKLNVPEGTADLYRNAGGWTNFALILEGDMLEIEIEGMTYLYVTGPRTATLIKSTTKESDLTIPSTITIEGVDYAVTAIGELAFVNASTLVNLTISEGIKTIEAKAFNNCQYINKVELPSTLTSIGDNAFAKCDRLTHIVSYIREPFSISESVFTTSTYANASLYVPVKTSESYKETDFWNKFTSVLEGDIFETIIDGMTYIYIPNLKIAKLTKGVSGVKDVTIPATISVDNVQYEVTAIDRSAFFGNNSLVNLTVSEGVKTIGSTAFKNCYSLKTISLPSSLTSIGDGAFEKCLRLTEVKCYGQKPIAINSNVFSVSSMIVSVPAGTSQLYKADENWGKFDIVEINSITISAAKQVPFYSDQNLDFTNLPDLKAYVATGYDKATGTIWLTRVKQVPAKTGFLLIGDAGTYEIPSAEGVSDCYYKNMFKGTLEGTTIKTTDGEYTNYYLSKGDKGVGFYKVTKEEGVTIGANRCYLPILTNIPANGSEGDTELIKVSSAKQVPYYTSKNLDFTSMEAQGVKAYTATGYNYGTGVIWLTRVKKVPAKTGVLVIANEAGEYSVPTTSVASVYENMFTGSEAAKTIYTTETIGGVDYINYYLSNGTNGVGFYKVTKEDGVNMSANRSYLQIPYREKVSGARGLSREATSSFCDMIVSDNDDDVIAISVFGSSNGDDDTTGINNVQQSVYEQDAYYTLQGQRVEKPGKGLYIKNGKKVIVR